jgi:hypothetical protein
VCHAADITNQLLCAPVFGEIYILPPRPGNDGPTRSAPTAASVPVPAAPAGRRPSSDRGFVAAPPTVSAAGGVARDPAAAAPVPAGVAALVLSTEAPSADGGAEQTMQASPVLGAASFVSPRPSTDVVTVAPNASAPVTLAPTRPLSGNARSGRSARNHGGIASFRAAHGSSTVATASSTVATAAAAVASAAAGSGSGSENVHPNVASSSGRTPHAKPIKSSHVIRVDGEALSRGPAAVLMDR